MKSSKLVSAVLPLVALLFCFQTVNSFAESFPIRALLAPRSETVLASQISGKITAMRVDNGDSFKAKQTLISFDCGVQNAAVKIAKAELKRAQVTLTSNEELHRHRAVGELELETAKAEVERARAELTLRQTFTDQCSISAPFSGRVVKRLAQPYQYVAEGTPLMEILDDSRLKMELFVPSNWTQWLKVEDQFQVQIDETGKVYPAIVKQLGAMVVSVSQTLPITAEIQGKHPELLAGMSGNAQFTLPVMVGEQAE